MAPVLARIATPADLRGLNQDELDLLATEIRDLLVETVARSLFTTVVISDLFMRVNMAMWYYNRRVATGGQADEYEQDMEKLTKKRFGA